MEELIKKYKNETLIFEFLYKGTVIYSNDKIRVNANIEYKSELELHMTLRELECECELLDIEEL